MLVYPGICLMATVGLSRMIAEAAPGDKKTQLFSCNRSYSIT